MAKWIVGHYQSPESGRAARSGVYLAPRTPTEELLATVWKQMLGSEQVGLTDNFFELGGHSLLTTRVIAQVRGLFQVEVPVRTLFDAPTLGEFARRIEALQRSSILPQLPPISAVERSEQLLLSFAQQRLWLLDQLEPGGSAYAIPAALRLCGPLSLPALLSSFQQLVQRHESLRTSFVSQQGTPLQVIAPSALLPLPLIDLQALPLAAREAQVRQLAEQEARRPFDLTSGPLLRLYLVRSGTQEHVLLLCLHHIISDGWSTAVLVRELGEGYRAALRGQPAQVPSLPIQYADYALWQRTWLQGERVQEQLEYWQKQLAGAPQVLNLPLDHPRPPVQSYVGARQTLRLSPALHQELERLSRREGATLFMTLLASFQVLLRRYTGQSDLLVGTSVSNRLREELERSDRVFCEYAGDPQRSGG